MRQVRNASAVSRGAVRRYRGFVENAYRLAFEYADSFDNGPRAAPILRTILPSGVVETEKELEPKPEAAIMGYATAPQTVTAEVAARHGDSPFVWRRADGSHALVQAWKTKLNASFRESFAIAAAACGE